MTDIVPPDIPNSAVTRLTRQQLSDIYQRIELIDQHFDRCCAHQLDKCQYAEEYDRLYGYLVIAGLPEDKTPMQPVDFERWLSEQPE